MILKDDFYTIISTPLPSGDTGGGSDLRFQVRLNPDHPIFRVHFVGNPVVPGVCLLQMGTELLEHQLGMKLQLQNAVNIKFRLPVKPFMQPTFVFTKVLMDNGVLKTAFTIEIGEEQYAKMSLLCHYSDL